MSQFTQEEQTQIVKEARELTATIKFEENELRILQAQTFRKLPEPPEHKILPPVQCVKPKYPEKPKTNYTYVEYLRETLNLTTTVRKIAAVVIAISVIWLAGAFLIYGFSLYLKKKNQMNKELENSPEYLKAIAEAEKIAKEEQEEREKERNRQQIQLDMEYQEEQEHYENVIVPEYNEELKAWEDKKRIKLEILQSEIELNNEALNNLYGETKIISIHYRELYILDWLYDEMSTADHDIRYATELFDRDRQRIATEEGAQRVQQSIARVEQSMMAGFNAVYNAIEDGNDVQAETLAMMSKTRRDANVGNLIGTVQRHNTNKMLKKISG